MEDNKKNIVYSPLSIQYALKMLEEGASGNTKQQISELVKDLAVAMNLKEYQDHPLEFIAIMPKDENITDYIKNLQKEDIYKITKEWELEADTKNGIRLCIPKFNFDYDLNLKQDLENMGVKAAAVTAFGVMDNAMIVEEEPILVEINHPFVFLIKDKSTDEIWFLGSVYEPNLWENDKIDYGG